MALTFKHRAIIVFASIAVAAWLAVSLLEAGPSLLSAAGILGRATATGQSPQTVHTLYGGFWRTDGGFVSTIRITDVLIATPLDVSPTLYMADGTPLRLPAVHVPAGGVTTINVNAALAVAQPSIAAHVSKYGSTSLTYSYPSAGHLDASTSSVDVGRSLVFTNTFMEMADASAAAKAGPGRPSSVPDASRQLLDATWWKRDDGVSGFVTVTNTTTRPVAATIRLVDSGSGIGTPASAVELASHQTQMVQLNKIQGNPEAGNRSTAAQDMAGGVRVEYEGAPGDLIVGGGLMNPAEGYSARLAFWAHASPSQPPVEISYGSTGIMVGHPDPAMMPGFPPQTNFAPYLVLRNTTGETLGVWLGVNYSMGTGESASLALPEQFLSPFQTRQVNLTAMLAKAGLAGLSGFINLEAQFTGRVGDLLVATGSVDQTGSYVFEVEPQLVDKVTRKIGSYWTTANGNDTMFSLWNPTQRPEGVTVSFRYGDGSGSYTLPVQLGAQGSTMLDVAMLKMGQMPGADGKPFAQSADEGSVSFKSATPGTWMTLVASGGTYDVGTATCGTSCVTCCGWTFSSFYMNPGSGSDVAVGGSQNYALYGSDCSTPGQQVPVSSWSSSNTSVATVGSSTGAVTGVAAGSVTLNALTLVYGGPDYLSCSGSGCPGSSYTTSKTINVTNTKVDTVNLSADEVQVTLQGPSGASGPLLVQWDGPSGNPDIVDNTTEGPGTYTFNPPLGSNSLAQGTYSGATATWLGSTNTYSKTFDVLGVWYHSQYNTPNESQCPAGSGSAYLVNGTTCAYEEGSLLSEFITQSWENGSGITINPFYGYNTEQNAQYCGNHGYLPSDWSGKSFASVPEITPSCSGYSISNSTVAFNSADGNVTCGDQILIVGLGTSPGTVKTATDYCPACSATQLDNYTESAACSWGAFGSLGSFQTIRINR